MHHHGAGLRKLTRDSGLVEALTADYRTALISEADRAMLAYVDRLTRSPASITADHIDSLRQAGFGDVDILDICQVAAYFAFVNRLADGLGVELESEP